MEEPVTNLFIPTRIFSDNELSFLEKGILAFEEQYPNTPLQSILDIFNISRSYYYKLKPKLNEKSPLYETKMSPLYETLKITQNRENDTKNIESVSEKSPLYETKIGKMSLLYETPEETISDPDHEKNVNAMVRYITNIKDPDDYAMKRDRISCAWRHTELYSDEDLKYFTKLLSEKLDSFQKN